MRGGSFGRQERRSVQKRFFLMQQHMEDDMTGPHAKEPHRNILIRWFGPNRNTHWTIAGSVAVILLGGYLVYSNRDGNPARTAISATETTPPPTGPAPLKSEQ
jgi:hypothetical protein